MKNDLKEYLQKLDNLKTLTPIFVAIIICVIALVVTNNEKHKLIELGEVKNTNGVEYKEITKNTSINSNKNDSFSSNSIIFENSNVFENMINEKGFLTKKIKIKNVSEKNITITGINFLTEGNKSLILNYGNNDFYLTKKNGLGKNMAKNLYLGKNESAEFIWSSNDSNQKHGTILLEDKNGELFNINL